MIDYTGLVGGRPLRLCQHSAQDSGEVQRVAVGEGPRVAARSVDQAAFGGNYESAAAGQSLQRDDTERLAVARWYHQDTMAVELSGDRGRLQLAAKLDLLADTYGPRELLERAPRVAVADHRQRWSQPRAGKLAQSPDQHVTALLRYETADEDEL